MKRIFTAFFTMLFALSLFAQAPKIIMVSPDGANGDDAQVAFLERNGFDVEKWWPGLLKDLTTQDTIDILNAADLVIVGRKTGSGDVGGDNKLPWNELTVPLILNSPWGARSTKLGMINNASATHGNTGPAMEYAQVLVPDDTIFSFVTLDGDSVGWMLPPHDYVGGADSATNGVILARTGVHPLVVRWEAGVAYFEGSTDTCRGPRVYFGFGNDDIGPGRGVDETVNFFPLTRAGKAAYLAEVCRLVGIPVQEPIFGVEDVRVMMYTDYPDDLDPDGKNYGQMDDIEQTRWLVNQGFYVTKFWAGMELGEAGQDTLDKMNLSVDVVIAGRSNNSGSFDGISKKPWNDLTVPLILNSQYAARSTRIGMFNSSSAFHRNTEYPVAYANVEVPADPVFTGVTLTGDSVAWTLAPHDFVGGLDSATNGTILAGSGVEHAPLVVKWDAGTEYWPGAGDEAIPAGPRYYFGFGNDNLRDNGTYSWTNDFNLTKAGKQAYLNAICLMGGIEVAQLPTAVTSAADATVTFVTDYDADFENDDHGYWDDQVQIDWLMKNGVHVNVFYPGNALSAASADTIDILNASELIIVGRSNNSGNFDGDDKKPWNDLTPPLIINSQYVARNTRIGMINSSSAFHRNTEYELSYANVKVPDSPAFTGVTLKGDSVAWTLLPHDFVGGLDSATNGTILAGSDLEGAPQIVTWDAGTEYYPGAGAEATPAGPRAFVAIGNDNLRDNDLNYRPDDFNLTDDGQQIYLNVISMMLGAKMTTAITVTSDAALDSLIADAGTMEPEFDDETMEYTLTLPEGITEVTLDAYPNSIFAMTIGDSTVSEITDTIDVEVHVIAENWHEAIYTVTIIPFEVVPGVGDMNSTVSSVKVYPNPATDMLYVESDVEISRVTVFNVVGSVVMDQNGLHNSHVQIDLGGLTPGMYMIRVDNGAESSMTKFLKR